MKILSLRFLAPVLLVCAFALLAGLASCATNTAPSIVFNNGEPATAGKGATPNYDQRVSFAVKIPPVPASSSTARLAVHRPPQSDTATPTPVPTALYLSPHTGSIQITLVAINGLSLAQPAPAVAPANVPASCAPAGCTVTVAGVPASNGVDRFAVVTFTGANGSGAIISSGVVDVSVPTGTTQTVGGGSSTTLTVGGFVASVSLSVTPTTYILGKPSSGSVVVSAQDATGATIIGKALFANPIVVSITSSATVLHFSFSGASSTSVTMPLSSPIPLTYDGGSTTTTTVQASTINGNGDVVNSSPVPLTVSFGPPPSPSPRPSPSISPPHGVSLYVLNAANNAVEEFPSPAPSATPRRSFGLTETEMGCTVGAVPYAVGMVQGIVVDASGNTTVTNNPACLLTGTAPFGAWHFSPSAVSTAPPPSFMMPSAYAPSTSQTLGYDPTLGLVLMQGGDAVTGTPAVLRLLFAGSGASISSVLGAGACIPLIGFTTCDGVHQYGGLNEYAVAVDSRGYTYLGGVNDLSGNPAIVVFSPGATVPIPYSALDGPTTDTELGPAPIAMAVDGTILYVLNIPTGAGFSNCGPLDSTTNVCADGLMHEYVTAYDTTKLVADTAVDLKPQFILGGDAIGHFGSASNGSTPGEALGQRLTAYKGLMYVANPSGPVCDSTCQTNASNGTGLPPSEVDIYNVSGLSGAHNNVAPTIILKEPNNVPVGVAVGGSGTATSPRIAIPPSVPGKFHPRLRQWAGHPIH